MHVYSLLNTPTTPLALPQGVLNPIQLVTHEQITAAVELDLSLEELQSDDATLLHAVLAHDRVIRELFQQTTVLPLRFMSFPSLEELQSDLQIHQQNYLTQLGKLQGHAEYSLKLIPTEIEDTPISSNLRGKDYFLAKKQQHLEQHRQLALQREEYEQILQAIERHYSSRVKTESRQIFILVSQNVMEEMHHLIAQLQEQYPRWQIMVEEALPPFHFV